MIYPAIDIYQGKSVRLYKGQYDQSTVINQSPIKQAQIISQSEIPFLHLVDLDGAKKGSPVNYDLCCQVARTINGITEVGGGIRTEETIANYLNNGLSRVILGSVALKNPDFTIKMLQKYGANNITIGIDGRNGKVATEGWLKQSKVSMNALIQKLIENGANRFIITDTETDGTLQGPNFNLITVLKNKFPNASIVASGGIRDLADIKQLQKLKINDIIVGKALAANKITLKQIAEVNNNVS